jgi:hypothetical protein
MTLIIEAASNAKQEGTHSTEEETYPYQTEQARIANRGSVVKRL